MMGVADRGLILTEKISEQLVFKHYRDLLDRKILPDNDEGLFKMHLVSILAVNNTLDWATEANVQDWLSVSLSSLAAVYQNGQVFSNKTSLAIVQKPVEQGCHASAAYHWTLHPDWEIYHGFSDRTHLHSWLYDPDHDTIYEPTPITRSHYFGFKVEDPEAFVESQLEQILYLRSIDLL